MQSIFTDLNIESTNISKVDDVCQSYNKPKLVPFFETRIIGRLPKKAYSHHAGLLLTV